MSKMTMEWKTDRWINQSMESRALFADARGFRHCSSGTNVASALPLFLLFHHIFVRLCIIDVHKQQSY